ncbi:MAG: glycosyltransferase family 9 protein [Verrucomicrobiota bacterium]
MADIYNETRHARKIIVVDLGYLGDSIHLLPALREIRDNYPQAELHVAATPVGSELLALCSSVDRTWPLARSSRGTPWAEQWRWIRDVRRQHFDVAFNFSGTDRTVFLTYLSRARWRVAFAGGRRHFWNPWLIPHWVPRVDRNVHVAEQRRQVLATCGLKLGPMRYDLALPEPATRWAEQHVPARAVHLSINAGHPLKEWPLERWTGLAHGLLERGPEVHLVATGTRHPREQARLQQLAAAVHHPRLHLYSGTLTVAQLAALLARCRLHVGADSGALHLATVLGVPTVSLFRDYEGLGEWLPRGEPHRSIVMPCRCVNQKIQPCAANARPDCLAAISVERVLQLIAVNQW